MRHYALDVVRVPNRAHNEGGGAEGWVEASVCEMIDVDECPENKTDCGNFPEAKVAAASCPLTRHVKDEKNEDESAQDFHVCSRPVLLVDEGRSTVVGNLNLLSSHRVGHHEGNLRLLDHPVAILLHAKHGIGEERANSCTENL